MRIIIGSTIAAFAMTEPDAWSSWLINAKEQQALCAEDGIEVRHFVAIETRGVAPFEPLIVALTDLGGEYWTYSLDDGRTEVTMTNRWRHITAGQNLVFDYCQSTDVDHLLFLACDTEAPPDIMQRMLEMDHPMVAPFISTYGLRGPVVVKYPFPVEDAMASAAAIFFSRSVFRFLRWRWDRDGGMSDDPCMQFDARERLGIPTYVRHDVRAKHHPEAVGPYNTRFQEEALKVHR
jgi:hypothetical protein